MKIKHKIGFVALITLLDVIVIVFVVMNNNKTSINNDINNKTAANIVEVEESQPENTETEAPIEEQPIEEQPIEEQPIEEQPIEEQPIEETTEIVENNISYDEMSIEEKENALNNGTLALAYSELYTNSSDRLTKSRGAQYYNGHRETYYDEKVLPGQGLAIPGRHVAEDGTIRDEEGYICVAANYEYMPKGSIIITSLGPAKVYDTGCAYGTIDIYVNW